MGRAASARLDDWYERYVPRAARVAFLMTGDPVRAGRRARTAWVTALGTFQDLRGEDELQIHIMRAATRARGRCKTEAGETNVALRALQGAPRRARAAAILTWHEELGRARTASILDCSPATLDSLLTAARGHLERALGRAAADSEITSALRRSTASTASPGILGARLIRLVRAGRRVVAGVAALTLLAGVTLGAEVARTVLSPRARAAAVTGDVRGRATTFGRSPAGQARPDRYRLGFSGACPSTARPLPLVRDARRDAGAAALRFNRALVEQDAQAVSALAADPRAASTVEWARTASARKLDITFSAPPSERDLRAFDCDPALTSRSWRVVMHDETGTTSKGIAVFYLVLTQAGWRVWASYEPAI